PRVRHQVPRGHEGRGEEEGGRRRGIRISRAERDRRQVMAIAIFERWGLNPREQRVASIALVVFGFAFLLAIPAGLQALVSSRRAENDELRNALAGVNNARGQIRDRQQKKQDIAGRYAKRAPQLAGFIEQNASAQKLQVTDSVDRPDAPHGKRYNERHTVV